MALVAGALAFLVTVNRAEITLPEAGQTPPRVTAAGQGSPGLTLDDVARADLSRTVTIEALRGNAEGLGTGWLLDTRGDFVTNAHVVQGELTVRIRSRDGATHVGEVVGSDAALDIAVVRSWGGFAGTPLPPMGGSATRLPEPVVAIGSSQATGHADLTDERITRVAADVPVTGDTALGEPPTVSVYHDMLVLDGATIYPGNSGGPVLDATGRVVGIVTLASRSAPEAYAIPLSRVLAELRAFAAR